MTSSYIEGKSIRISTNTFIICVIHHGKIHQFSLFTAKSIIYGEIKKYTIRIMDGVKNSYSHEIQVIFTYEV